MTAKGKRGSAAGPPGSEGLRLPTLFAAGLLACAAMLAIAAPPAAASSETARADISMESVSGSLYREAPRPVNWRVEAEITAPWPESGLVLPMKKIRVTFPEEMSFNPDPRMPVCPDSKVGPPPVFLSAPPATVIARCPRSVLGNGTSEVYLARINSATGPGLRDGVMVIFNGGRNPDGSPRIKVYGFSAALATGIYLEGTLKGNILLVDIAQLPVDSAVGRFDLNIPGASSPFANRRGRDPDFVRATCSSGSWTGSASFTLGTRDTAGNATGEDSTVESNSVTKPCTGAVGRPRLRIARVSRTRGSRSSRKAIYTVTVRNTGTASASGFQLKTRGRRFNGTARIASIAPGASRRVRVGVRRAGSPPFSGKPPKPAFRIVDRAG